LLAGIPFGLKEVLTKRYPGFNALLQGLAPYDTPRRRPARVAIMACFAVAAAVLGLVALLLCGVALEYVWNTLGLS